MAKLSGLPTTQSVSFGLLIAAMIFVAFGVFGRSWWPSHHEQILPIANVDWIGARLYFHLVREENVEISAKTPTKT